MPYDCDRRQAGWVAVAAAAACFVAMPVFAQTNAPSEPVKWGPFIDFEGKAGTKRNIGEGDLFAPLWQDTSSLVFGDLRTRFDDHNSGEGNVGVGVRHMLESGWNLGAYGYFDRRRSENAKMYNQVTVGAEALSLDWDVRANTYIPEGTRAHDLSTSGGDSTASIVDTSVQVSTSAVMVTQEKSMRGFDGEIGWRVPVFAAIDTTQLRVYAGGYRFTADGVNPVQGPRGRIDLTMYEVPHLWEGARLELGAEVQNDAPRGTQAFAVARLRIPLEVFGGERPNRLTPMERRMTDPIVRDVDVVSQQHTVVASPAVVETATALSGGGSFTVLNSGSTAGNSLATAITNAGSNATIILSGTFNVSATNGINTGFNQTIESGAIGVRTPSGHTATLNASASIVGTNVTGTGNSLITVQAGTALKGLTLTNNFSGGTAGETVLIAGTAGNVNISNNTITVTQSGNSVGTALAFQNSNTGTVSGNTLTATGSGSATTMTALIANQSTTTITVSGNTMSATGGGTANDLVQSGSHINAGSTGNIRGSGVCSGSAASGAISFTDGSSC